MRIIKPKRLKKNDVIGIISPASSPADLSRIQKGVNYLEKLGFRVEVGKNVGKQRGYLAGEDDERLSDFHRMFEDKNVRAIFCVRGGYGSGRLLDKINFNLIRKNPKIFVGYSDITYLQLAMLKKAGLVTFAGPMLAVDFFDEVDEFTEEAFWRIITSSKKIGKIFNPENEPFYKLNSGRADGIMLSANLSILTSMLGTNYLPDFNNKLLLIEDVDELPYKIDRMFNQLKLSGVFKKIKGLILGRFVDCFEKDAEKSSLSLNEVIEDYLKPLPIPVIYNVKHGHIKKNLTIPIGIKAKMNASRKFIEFTESAVV